MAWTSSIYNHFDLKLTRDLDLQPTWKIVTSGTFLSQGQQLCKFFLKSMHNCTSYGPDKLNIWPFWPLFDPCDLDLQPTRTFFQVALFLLEGNNCAKLFWNPCINVQVMARRSSIHVYDHFDLYLTPVTLTFNLPKTLLDLNFQPAYKCFKWHFSSSRATTVHNRFEIHALLYKLWSGQIRTDARMHIHWTKIVTTMSRLPASGLDKNEVTHSEKLDKYPKYDAYLLDIARDVRQNQLTMKYMAQRHINSMRTMTVSDWTSIKSMMLSNLKGSDKQGKSLNWNICHSDLQKYEVTRSVKCNKYPKYDTYVVDRARDIWQIRWTMKYRSKWPTNSMRSLAIWD